MFTTDNAALVACQLPDSGRRLDYLTAYCAGWARGDLAMIRAAVTDDYSWNDPEEGCASKDGLGGLLTRLTAKIDELRDGGPANAYLTLSEPLVDSSRPTTIVWWRFAVPGTAIRGLSQIRLGDQGVISEHRTYQSQPHVRIAGLRSGAKADRRNRAPERRTFRTQ